jgi:hypothetical protein
MGQLDEEVRDVGGTPMSRWIVFACGAVILCGAAWYFGKPEPVILPTHIVAVAEPAENVPQPPPPRVVEVIDLARAYEPVPESEEVLPGAVDPATFIQVPEVADRIPPAIDTDNSYADVIRTVREAPSGWSFWNGPDRERIDLMPREVLSLQDCLRGCNPGPGALSASWIPAQRLNVMPREVKREEQKRRTGVREDDLIGAIDP